MMKAISHNHDTEAQYNSVLNIEYAPGLRLDLVRPADNRVLPAIIWFHGGAWRMGDRTWRPDFVSHFSAAGFVMVSIDYTLSGAATFPQPLHDARAAIRFLRAHANQYGINPKAIGAWGSSAGGHLAALTGLHGSSYALDGESADGQPDLTDASVAAVVDGYGPADLLADDQDNCATAALLGHRPAEDFERARTASPALLDASGAPPFLILHGAADDLVPPSQSMALYKSLAAADVDATLYVIDAFGHGFLNPAGQDEVAPGPRLDSGRLEAEPSAPALVCSSREAEPCNASASFELIKNFFTRHLNP